MELQFGAHPCAPSQAGGRADFIGGQRNWVSQVAVVGDPQVRILGISDSQYIYTYIHIYIYTYIHIYIYRYIVH